MNQILFIFALIFSIGAQARGLSAEEKMQDFQQLQSLIQAKYGPFQFKAAQKIVDFSSLNDEFTSRVKNSRTNQEFYTAIIEYVARFQDGHFGIRAQTDRVASVAFNTDLIGEKVLITFIDREKLPKDKFNFEIGDEILAVNSLPTPEALLELSKPVASGNRRTVKRIAAMSIPTRHGVRYALPNEKQVTFRIRRGTSELIEDISLDWDLTGTAMDENDSEPNKSILFSSLANGEREIVSFWDARDRGIELLKNPSADRRYSCSGETRIFVPKGATYILKKPFVAYTYPTEKGLVGYVRFPHYSPRDEKGKFSSEILEDWFNKLLFVIHTMEKETVGLIIDQDHNCGGSVRLVEDTVGLFVEKPVRPLMFKLRATKAQYMEIKKEMEEWAKPDTLEYAFFKRMMELVEKTWRTTNDFMTELTSLTGSDWIYPNAGVRYTKPIVILIDEMAGSGGDAFPSMMKDYGRAKLFGQQTAGLGGSVISFASLFHSNMSINMTNTLFFKPNGEPVENNGAVPDEFYTLTRDDVIYEYRPYQKAYTEYLLKQLP